MTYTRLFTSLLTLFVAASPVAALDQSAELGLTPTDAGLKLQLTLPEEALLPADASPDDLGFLLAILADPAPFFRFLGPGRCHVAEAEVERLPASDGQRQIAARYGFRCTDGRPDRLAVDLFDMFPGLDAVALDGMSRPLTAADRLIDLPAN
ncbi:hypothetical protein [Oceanomicrobium pacificus]|uniref:Uncharacterized protein n=1 Tax=Oceanomicrobium pacificus TaxID=2692916 RepID=A0A6B0U021_9RHOB|nr:hypothetical protein [Oceanomicrobium pacificus]MXU66603.1 hypothetical protein [Oceanomicrobium pacificus]